MKGAAMIVREDDLTHPATRALLRQHLEGMREATPQGHVFALDLAGLAAPEVTVWSAWRDDDILGIGALRRLDAVSGEVKSMRTHPDHLREGVGAAILECVIDRARELGLGRLSLETGVGPAFEAAVALYVRRGFRPGAAFGGYAKSPFNRFLHLDLANTA